MFVLLVVFINAYLVIKSISQKHYKNISVTLENQVKTQIEHYKQINAMNKDLRKFKHDYNNHMLCLKSMIELKELDEAAKYIEALGDFLPGTDNFNTGNYIADALLEEKNTACIQKDISFECSGIIPYGRMSPVDLCILLANLLDNAIESCEKCEKINGSGNKKIKAVFDFKNDHLFISLSNSVCEQVKIHNNFITTTKKNASAHGFGLMNIHRVVNKYDGDLKMYCDNKIFNVEVVLPLLGVKVK